MASSSPSKPSLDKHVICAICMEAFTEPVTTACGHSFCKSCLERHLHYASSTCPICKSHVSKTPGVNIVLRDLTQHLKFSEFVGNPGEVACDVCITPKLKADKSCLVCLASYCSLHLQNHHSSERLKGHKLVEPVENLDSRACLTHGLTFELYSKKQQMCICIRCVNEGQEEVVSAENEWNNKKSQLENTKTGLLQEIEKRQKKLDEINAALKTCKDQLENEWWDIEGVFRAMIAILETAQEKVLEPLEERRRVLENQAKELKDELETEIQQFEKNISDLEDISVLEDHILFLQRYPSLKVQDDIKDWTDVKLDTNYCFGTMKNTTTTMMEKIQQELEKLAPIELERFAKFKVDVKLDRTTAHQRLVVSDDGKEVKDGGENWKLKDGGKDWEVKGGGEDQKVKDRGEDQEMKDGEDQETKDRGEDQKVKDRGEDQEMKDGGEDQEVKEGGEDQEVKDRSEDQEVKDRGEDQKVKDGGEDQEVKDGGEDQEMKDGGEDQKVKDGGEDQKVKDGGEDLEEDGPERFDHFSSVLGINSFISGKSYWEVEVNKKSGWDLGVARGDANRKGKLMLDPDNGYWVLVHYEEENYAAMTAPPTRLPLKEKPTKVGVLVDYEKGLVSFYDVTAQSHVYSFTNCLFKNKIYPYFSPHLRQDKKNSEPLVISAGKDFGKKSSNGGDCAPFGSEC